jgi:hypothetical protein
MASSISGVTADGCSCSSQTARPCHEHEVLLAELTAR